MSAAGLPILFVSTVRWDVAWQRHQTLATLATRTAPVVFLELPGLRRPRASDIGRLFRARNERRVREPLPPGLSIAPVRLLPPVLRALDALNRRRLLHFAKQELAAGVRWLITYSPAPAVLCLAEAVRPRRLIYECTDDFRCVEGIPHWFAAAEERMLRAADLTVVPSLALASSRASARRLLRLPHGVFADRFQPVPARKPDWSGGLDLLYYGHIHRQHLDIEALRRLALDRPSWRIRLVGSRKHDPGLPANVLLHGPEPHAAIRGLMERCDALLLPYSLNEYTRSVQPAKTFECLASGLPVVATPLPELLDLAGNHMTFVEPGASWAEAVERTLRKDTADARAGRTAEARANGWEDRWQTFVRAAEAARS